MSLKIVKELVQEFESLQKRYADFGAWDSKPCFHFRHAMREAMSGNRVFPTSASSWELCSMSGAGTAARKMTALVKKVIDAIMETKIAEAEELLEFIEGYW